MNESWIEGMADMLADRMLDDDEVRERVCDGCRLRHMSRNDPNGCDGLDESCLHWDRICSVVEAAQDAARLLAEAV